MHFLGLHIKSLISLKIVSATFGIGLGGIALIAPPLATRLYVPQFEVLNTTLHRRKDPLLKTFWRGFWWHCAFS